ncbi:MAG: SUMF1/EgtB/PvdO family nonheme iron enzyme [Pseudomonadota bacterium]
MADVFISYKKEDRALAEQVEAALVASGLSSWWDTSLHPRESWDAIIQREIAEAKAVIVIWTPRSVRSEWVRIEANYGKQHGKLVPLLVEACDIPLAFTLTQAANLTDWDGSDEHKGWQTALGWVQAHTTALHSPDPLPEQTTAPAAPALHQPVAVAPVPTPRQFEPQGVGVSQSPPPFNASSYVYISHPRDIDRDLMRAVVRALFRRSVSVWLWDPAPYALTREEQLAIGRQSAATDFAKAMLQRIETAPCNLLLIGEHSKAGGFQTQEIDHALAHGIYAAARVDGVEHGGLPSEFQTGFLPDLNPAANDDETIQNRIAGLADDVARIVHGSTGVAKESAGQKRGVWAFGVAVLFAAVAVGWWTFDTFVADGTITETSGSTEAAVENAVLDSYSPGDEFRDCDECPEMVVIPSGSFVIGSPSSEAGRQDDEGPLRTVQIGYELAVGKYEVTWAEWEACVADGGCDNAGPLGAGGDNGWGRGSRPVIRVSWEDAQAYVLWLSRKTGERYRLLSEAEWEYAARGVTTPTAAFTRFSWGDGDPTCSRGARNGAVFIPCEGSETEPVGFSAANAFGLHDLHGNVWEWTQDCYQDSYSGAPTDGSARLVSGCSQRVLRGGSWVSNPIRLRSANRSRYLPSNRGVDVGFRVARTLSPPTP